MKSLLLFSLFSILAICEKLTDQENSELQTKCGKSKESLTGFKRKILNGVPIFNILYAPWVVSIEIKDSLGKLQHCSGSLISQRHVVTAAHCFLNDEKNDRTNYFWASDHSPWNGKEGCDGDDLILPSVINKVISYHVNTTCAPSTCSSLNIVSSPIKREARKVILPGRCAPKPAEEWYNVNDFAIVELETDLTLSDSVMPACVAKYESDVEFGAYVMFAGYGSDSASREYPNGLLKLQHDKTIARCGNPTFNVDNDVFCTLYNSNRQQMGCEGDGGGGAVRMVNERMTVVGVLAKGMKGANCSSPENSYNVYVKLTKHKEDVCKLAGVCPTRSEFVDLKKKNASNFGNISMKFIIMCIIKTLF